MAVPPTHLSLCQAKHFHLLSISIYSKYYVSISPENRKYIPSVGTSAEELKKNIGRIIE